MADDLERALSQTATFNRSAAVLESLTLLRYRHQIHLTLDPTRTNR
jgi:hypothetical protein